uniref:Protein arginine N-methyltransferase 9 isoform X1 n=1 Tax=Petromyzon marinus TaxID=7757 RepID=A0AAJ7T727_PETMA|nr:protein arginine N-methyltransferase 9 isoform X1 [Petromyzon marinus]XP_032811351.1 protein arginine N-methyltransferase 9 isoform X1 [Petromyzon marinus]XP_032811352.1 protein arginine N-methyltransferase 9 isoform X1 [Petromyzon marinus]XP_032811353.1 protein arginine N-methyltransferase 9 isoform X1 [Petromyzon marinus]
MSSGGARDGNDEDGARRMMRRRKKKKTGGRDKRVDTARDGGHRSLVLARDLVEAKDPGTGFAHYLLALTLVPALRSSVQAEFRDCARAWTSELEELGRARDAFDCYEQALALYPEDELILNGMGESLFRLGFWDEAAACFLRALRSAPGWAPARENFRRAASWLLERWHFPMLNDRRRNEAYRDALRRAVAKRGGTGCCTVLDIGAGTGILSMFARQAGASRVFACEVSRTAVQLAREVLSANGFAGDVSLLHAASNDLAVPRDLPERVSLVVTETMDAALLGEGIVESLIHAWRHLLLPPPPTATVNGADAGVGAGCGQVIPAGATVYACAVECPEIRRYHRLCVREACGTRLDTGVAFRSLVGLPPRIGRDTPTNNDEDDDEEGEEGKDADNEGSCREPYTTERMSRVPGGYTLLCDSFPVLAVDFNNPQELEGLFSRAPERRGARVTCGGTLDAIVAWFRLRLDEESSLSTAPGEDSCWEQAVYPVTPVRGWNGYTVREGDTLEIEAVCRDGHLGLSCVSVTPAWAAPDAASRRAAARPAPGSTPQLDDASTAAEVATPEGDGEAWLCSAIASLGTASGWAPGVETCALEPWEVARLNDVEHWEAFSRAARDAPGRRSGGAGPLRVLDLSAGLSVLPLVVARACGGGGGADGVGAAIVCSSAEDPRRRRALRALAAANGVAAQLRFLDDGGGGVGSAREKERGGGVRSEPGCGTASGAARPPPDDATEDETMGEQRQEVVVVESEEDGTEDGSWDVIVLEAVEPTGLLRQGLVEKAALARSLLRPGGTVLPLGATLVGQLLESDALLSDSVALGSGPTLGLRIAPFLNLFSVPTQVNLDLCTLPGRRLSRPFEVFTLDLMAAGSEAAAQHCVTAIAEEPGRVTAVALWVELRLGDGAAALSTLRAHSHVKQAAVALEEALSVSAGSRVEVRAHSHEGDVSLACGVAPAAATTTAALP